MRAYQLIEYLLRNEQLKVKVLNPQGVPLDIEVVAGWTDTGAACIIILAAPVVASISDVPEQLELPVRKGRDAAFSD